MPYLQSQRADEAWLQIAELDGVKERAEMECRRADEALEKISELQMKLQRNQKKLEFLEKKEKKMRQSTEHVVMEVA